MTDLEIIEALIRRDNQVTQDFLFKQCRPLLNSIIRRVFDYEVDYDECVNELYLYLMANDGEKLRQFEGRSSLYTWLKVTTTRFLIKKRHLMIDNASHEPLYQQIDDDESETPTYEASASMSMAKMDVERLLASMPNQRYAGVIRQLVLEEREPEQVAMEMKITVDNLYNIKRRAILQLTQVALRDIQAYGTY